MWDTFIEDNMDVFNGRAATRLQTLTERKKEEYREVISLLKRGYSVRNTAKFCFTNPLPLGKVNTFPLHSLNRDFQALASAQCKELKESFHYKSYCSRQSREQ